MGWSLESPIIPYNGANRVLNDCQLSAVRYWVGCSGSLLFLPPKVSLPAMVG